MLIHGDDILCNTIRHDLPPLIKQLEQVLAALEALE